MPRRGRPGRVGLGVSLLALPLACSTLATPEPVVICVSDDDCDKSLNEICGAGACYASNLPARDEVALDISPAGSNRGSFRLEIYGPDHAVARIDTPPVRYHVSLDNHGETAGVRDELRLSLLETYRFGDQVDEVPLRADLTLTQSSRLGAVAARTQLPLDPFDADGVPLDPQPTSIVPWAHYDSNDKSPSYSAAAPEPERPLLINISAKDGIDPESKIDVQRGIVYRQLVREQQAQSGTHAFTLRTDRDCHRKLHGSALIVGDGTPPPVSIGVELVHARRDPAAGPICDPEPATGTPAVCSPQTLARVSDYKPVPCTADNQCPQSLGCYPTGDDDDSRTCGCNSDAECPTGQACALESHRCALDLASADLGAGGGLGLTATESGVATDIEKSDFVAWVYTYCEDDLQGDREMEFVVRATPTPADDATPPPLPPLSFHTSVDFVWQNGDKPRAELKNMCFPAWAPPQPLAFDVSSAPQELYRGPDEQAFVCCTPACLDLANPAPTAPASCRLAATLTAKTVFTPDPELWSTFSCMELDVGDSSLPAGSQRITYSFDKSMCIDGPCDIALSAGTDKLEYELRIEPPVGSLIRSMILPTPQVVEAGTTTSLTIPKLEYRVLLRGSVTADDCPEKPDEETPAIDCPRASILAERLKVAGEEPALAPTFLTASTIPGSYGDFVLPLNPGVYLVTALPASGSPGGPADIRVVDLRLDSKQVDTRGPIPIADLASPLNLDVGKLVTVELEGFGRSSRAVPLDVGYWANPKTPLKFNGTLLNLNDPMTCAGTLNRGCQIRRLRIAGSSLALTQESYVKYLARGASEPE